MITLEQARTFYSPDQVPSDQELQHALATAYAIAEREWDEMLNEKNNTPDD